MLDECSVRITCLDGLGGNSIALSLPSASFSAGMWSNSVLCHTHSMPLEEIQSSVWNGVKHKMCAWQQLAVNLMYWQTETAAFDKIFFQIPTLCCKCPRNVPISKIKVLLETNGMNLYLGAQFETIPQTFSPSTVHNRKHGSQKSALRCQQMSPPWWTSWLQMLWDKSSTKASSSFTP